MGAGAGKQPKVKTIYVKSKDSSHDEDEVQEALSSCHREPEVHDQAVSSTSLAFNNAELLSLSSAQVDVNLVPPIPDQPVYVTPALEGTSVASDAVKRQTSSSATVDVHSIWCTASSSNASGALEENMHRAPAPSCMAGKPDRSADKVINAASRAPVKSMQTTITSFSSDEGSSEDAKFAQKQVLSPRSISSDEGSEAQAPEQIPKIAFAQVLQEANERRAGERSEWLKSVTESAADTIVENSAPTNFTTKKEAGFNDTRRPLTVLRDPDILQEVRKWNTNLGAYREEVPRARPLRC